MVRHRRKHRTVTAWATTDCMACEFLEKARSKISTMVVGLDFYTTSPPFLESFLSVIRIGKPYSSLHHLAEPEDCSLTFLASNLVDSPAVANAVAKFS